MSTTVFVETQTSVAVPVAQPTTVLQVEDRRPHVVVEEDRVTIIAVGVQGPPGPQGPTSIIPGQTGDVLFNGGAVLGADTEQFRYLVSEQALRVSRLTGATLDGGNF